MMLQNYLHQKTFPVFSLYLLLHIAGWRVDITVFVLVPKMMIHIAMHSLISANVKNDFPHGGVFRQAIVVLGKFRCWLIRNLAIVYASNVVGICAVGFFLQISRESVRCPGVEEVESGIEGEVQALRHDDQTTLEERRIGYLHEDEQVHSFILCFLH